MGDPFAVEAFGHSFEGPIKNWNISLWRRLGKRALNCGCECPVKINGDTVKVDMSLTKYADDVVKTMLAEKGDTVHTLMADVKAAVENLDEELEPAGYKQNKKKLVTVLALTGAGSKKGYQEIKAKNVEYEGKVKTEEKSLGSIIAANCSVVPERKARVEETKKAFLVVGSLWSEPGIPWKFRRMMFICKVQNTALSGMIAYAVSATDCLALDAAIASVGRLFLRGRACKQTGEGDEKKYKAMTTRQVLKEIGIATAETELRIRRIAWYQKMAQAPEDHVQVLCAIGGTFNFEKDDEEKKCVLEDGSLGKGANPWTKQFADDLVKLATLDCFSEFAGDIEARPFQVFTDEAVAAAFCLVDPSELKQRELREYNAVPPPLSCINHRRA